MRKLALMAVAVMMLSMVTMLAGCDGAESPSPTPTSTATPAPTTAPTATPQPTTPPPTQSPTPTVAPTPTPTSTLPPMAALPCRFRGTVELNGSPVPDGTEIKVTIAGEVYSTTTPSVYGASTYVIRVEPKSVVYSPGTVVTFKIGGQAASQTSTWDQGGNIEVDISAG